MKKICIQCGKEFNAITRNNIRCKDCRNKGYKHICEVCGKEFFTSYHEAKYCSEECKKMAKNTIVTCTQCGKEFLIKNSKVKKHNFCSIECSAEYKKKKHICKNCGEQYEINKNRYDYEFCSFECKKEYHKNDKDFKFSDEYYEKVYKCDICGKEFKYKDTNSTKYCSYECRMKSKNKKIYHKKCLFCGKEIQTTFKSKKFCSQKCISEYKRSKKPLPNHTCAYCGKEFYDVNASTKYCSIKCARKDKIQSHIFLNKCHVCGKVFTYTNKVKYCNTCRPKNTFSGIQCKYKDLHHKLRSTWELRTCQILDKMKDLKLIKEWNYEVDKIKYNGEHHYIIDFTIFLNNDDFCFLEVKGKMTKKDKLKISTTRKEYIVDLWTLKEIKIMEDILEITEDDINYFLVNCII